MDTDKLVTKALVLRDFESSHYFTCHWNTLQLPMAILLAVHTHGVHPWLSSVALLTEDDQLPSSPFVPLLSLSDLENDDMQILDNGVNTFHTLDDTDLTISTPFSRSIITRTAETVMVCEF